MAYITSSDYLPILRDTIKARVTEDDAAVLEAAELQVQALAQGYLISRYDMPTEWARTGTARSADLVRAMVSIIVFDIMCRVAPNQMPSWVQTRYENAMEWLKMVQNGEVSPALPLPEDTNGNPVVGGMLIGSDAQFLS